MTPRILVLRHLEVYENKGTLWGVLIMRYYDKGILLFWGLY